MRAHIDPAACPAHCDCLPCVVRRRKAERQLHFPYEGESKLDRPQFATTLHDLLSAYAAVLKRQAERDEAFRSLGEQHTLGT